MSRIDEILDKLDDKAPTDVDLPGLRDEVFRCKALLIKHESPHLELLFPPNAWKAGDLKIGANCSLAIEQDGKRVSLIAKLDSITNERRLQFTAREPITPESMRDYFRVAINTAIQASYVAEQRETKVQSWKLAGTTIDLSGSGVLAMFAAKPPSSHRILLEITPPEDIEPIFCLAEIVRTYRLRSNRFQVAFHFIEVTTKTRDQIISCCLKEQRRQLRENVRIE